MMGSRVAHCVDRVSRCRAAEKVGAAATASGNWLWNAGSKAGNVLKGDTISVSHHHAANADLCLRLCRGILQGGTFTPVSLKNSMAVATEASI